MINEKQAEILLKECEQWLGKELSKLRTKLKRDHENTESALWELIVLHATASSIVSRNYHNTKQSQHISSLIQHEPQEAAPDIFLTPNNCLPFYIEVAYINHPQKQQQEDNLSHFPRWIRKELTKKGIDYGKSIRIKLAAADSTKDIQVPQKNSWNNQLRTDNWKSFVSDIASRNFPSIWIPDEANIIVTAEGIDQGFSVSSSFPAVNVPKRAEDNPVYKTIKDKAEQAKKWVKSGKSYQPLVLLIGASKNLHQINGHDILKLKKAVYSALADTKQWDSITRLNLTDNRSWPWAMRSQRVTGARLISAVVIVTVKTEYSVFELERKASKPLIIKNPHPDIPLTLEQERLLEQIDFNQIKYGSGRENWERPQNNQDVPLLNKYKYLRESGGRFTFSSKLDSTFSVEIPSKLVAHFLAGNVTANEIWDFDDESTSVLSIEQTIGYSLKEAANNRQLVVNVELVQGNYRLREESRIRFEFGTFAASIKKVKDCFRDSREFDTSGAFTLTLSTNLVICLLAGKITDEEAWKSESRQEIGKFLKDAVSKGQEIIDVKFIPDSLVYESEAQIIFQFEPPNDKLIRENKKQK